MSLSGAVNAAVKAAKKSLGDVIVGATLRKPNSVYDTTQGKYVDAPVDTPVEVAPDRFTFNEQQDQNYQINDVKLIVFNPNNDLEISTEHKIVYLGYVFNIRKADPTPVGGFKPIWTLMIRK